MARFAGAALLWVWVWASAAGAQPAPATVVAVLTELRHSGVDVLYSSELVAPQLPLTAPLRAVDPLARAGEALAPYGLILQRVDAGRYLVTRAPATVPPPTPPSPVVPAPAPPLAEISVYASQYTLGGSADGEPKSLSSSDIDHVPGSDDKALRATRELPGVASNGSSRAYIRGSPLDDVLLEFDGAALADPFHMKDFHSLISAFDTAAVDRIDVYSGGFPVRYGTRSGGVIDITPRSLGSGYENTLGASLRSFNMSSVGHADRWPLDWLVTARTSTPFGAPKSLSGEIGVPQFTESIGRLRWNFTADAAVSVGWLLLDDRSRLATNPADESVTARYRDEYAWSAFDWSLTERLHSRTILAVTEAERTRDGALLIEDVATGRVHDSRSFSRVELHSDWSLKESPQLAFNYGVEATSTRAQLQYARVEQFEGVGVTGFGMPADNSLHARATPEANTFALLGDVRRRWASFEADLGVRLDGQQYEGFAVREQWSPRLNMRYDLASQWHVYGSWGRFTQAQRPEEWRIEVAQVRPDMSELAIHTILGITYERSQDTRFGVEAYRKRWTNVSPYLDNTLEKLSLVPDLAPDRVLLAPRGAETAGVELSARRTFSPFLEGWANYAWSHVYDEFSGRTVLRGWDQPHALTSGLTWTEGQASASVVAGWHRGWPRTPFAFAPATASTPASVTLGAPNSTRWGNYFTVDLRSSWSIPLRHSDFSTWVDLSNGTGRRNPCCLRFMAPENATETTITQPNSWFPRTFNLGVAWRFNDRH